MSMLIYTRDYLVFAVSVSIEPMFIVCEYLRISYTDTSFTIADSGSSISKFKLNYGHSLISLVKICF
jgi:hypothetical protein